MLADSTETLEFGTARMIRHVDVIESAGRTSILRYRVL